MFTPSQKRFPKRSSATIKSNVGFFGLRLFLCLGFCIFSFYGKAQDTILLSGKNFVVRTDSLNMAVFEDPEGASSFPAVKSLPFKPYHRGSLYLEFSRLDRTFWQKIILKNTTGDTLPCYLKNPGHDILLLYAEFSNGALIEEKAGSNVPRKDWAVPDHKYSFYLNIPAGQAVVCWINARFVYASADPSEIAVFSPTDFNAELKKEHERFGQHFWMGVAFLAITLFLFLFTFFQYWQLRERMYLYYSAYVGFSFFYFFRKMEKFAFFRSPISDFPNLVDYPETLNALLVHIMYFIFVIEFLDLKKQKGRLYGLLNILTWICIAYIVGDACVMLFTGSMSSTVVPYLYFRMVLLAPMLVGLFLIVRRHYMPLGRYVFWGSALLVFGSVLSLLYSLFQWFNDVLPIQDPFFFTYAGTLLECLIFSLGLGYKGRIVLEERNKLQGELLTQLEENNKIEAEARKRMEEELRVRTEEIHRKNKELEVLRMEQTRLRIARDLHDEMGSTLSSISIMAESAKRGTTNEQELSRLDFIGEKTREVMESMSDIVWSVNPANDRFEQVIARMEELTTTLMTSQEIPFNFEVNGDISRIDIPMDRRKDFYLIFKEALNNIVKYAHAAKVEVLVETPPGMIRLTVRDNGVGFDPENIQAGMGGNGLRNMRTRAQMIGGRIDISSQKGAGTTIVLETPA